MLVPVFHLRGGLGSYEWSTVGFVPISARLENSYPGHDGELHLADILFWVQSPYL